MNQQTANKQRYPHSSSTKMSFFVKHSPSSAPEAVPQRGQQSFTLLSYNVNFAFARYQDLDHNASQVLQAVSRNPADIVCLQETHEGWQHYFRQLLRKTHPYSHYHHRPAAGGIAVHSRFPLSNVRILDNHERIDGSWFPVWTGVVHVGKQRVKLVNVHLRPPITENGWPHFVMPWARSVRQEELQYSLRALGELRGSDEQKGGGELPMIIAGDFNESETERGLQWLKNDQGFTDAVERFVPKTQETHRWPLQIPVYGTHTLKHRLDHIAFRAAPKAILTCSACRVIPGYENNASDHMPLLATFHIAG